MTGFRVSSAFPPSRTNERRFDYSDDGHRFLQNVAAPETQIVEPPPLQLCRPTRIASKQIGVLAVVDFDREPGLETNEVNDEGTKRCLTAVFVADEPTRFEISPNLLLDFGARHPKRAANCELLQCVVAGALVSTHHGHYATTRRSTPPSTPSLKGTDE